MAKKRAVKKNFEDVMNHIRDSDDANLQINFRLMTNEWWLMAFTVDEMIKLISDKIVAKFIHDLLTSNDFSILTKESSEEAG